MEWKEQSGNGMAHWYLAWAGSEQLCDAHPNATRSGDRQCDQTVQRGRNMRYASYNGNARGPANAQSWENRSPHTYTDSTGTGGARRCGGNETSPEKSDAKQHIFRKYHFEEHCYTEDCEGCLRLSAGMAAGPHTEDCRKRM